MFSYDNAFFRFMTKFADILIVSALWVVFSIPVITLGPATSALYYTVHKVIKKNREYVWRSFWGEFKNNIKDSIIVTVIMELLFFLMYFDISFFKQFLETNPDSKLGLLYYFFYFLRVFVVLWFIYICCYRARFVMGWKGSIINGLKFFISNFRWALLILVALVLAVIIISDMPFFLFIFPALIALLCDFCMERVFRLFMTEEELMKEDGTDIEDPDYMDAGKAQEPAESLKSADTGEPVEENAAEKNA